MHEIKILVIAILLPLGLFAADHRSNQSPVIDKDALNKKLNEECLDELGLSSEQKNDLQKEVEFLLLRHKKMQNGWFENNQK